MASWKKILTSGNVAAADLAASGNNSKFLRGDMSWQSVSTANYYLDAITKSSNTLTFSVNGGTNVTYTFGSNAFNSTTIPTGALAALDTVGASTITDNSVGAAELNVSGDGTSGQVLTSAADGSFTWTAKTVNTDTKWSGTSTGLTAATGRTSLGGTTVGQNAFTLTNPSALSYFKIAANNTVSAGSLSSAAAVLLGLAHDTNDSSYYKVQTNGNVVLRTGAELRGDINAGTSNLALGTTGSTALAGNTTVDNVSVTNLKSALASDMGGAVTIGDSNDTVTIAGDLTVSGDTTTVNTSEILVEDINITLGNVSSPSASTGNGGGMTVKTGGTTEPQINWKSGTGWVLYERNESGLMPLATVQEESSSGAPSGLQNAGGRFAYNSADGEMYFYDAT